MVPAHDFSFTSQFKKGNGEEPEKLRPKREGIDHEGEDLRQDDVKSFSAQHGVGNIPPQFEGGQLRAEGGPEDVFFVFEVAKERILTDLSDPGDFAGACRMVSLTGKQLRGSLDDFSLALEILNS